MQKTWKFLALAFVALAFLCANGSVDAFDEFNVWPGPAPGENPDAPKPTYEYWKPEKQTTDSVLIVCPGGGY